MVQGHGLRQAHEPRRVPFQDGTRDGNVSAEVELTRGYICNAGTYREHLAVDTRRLEEQLHTLRHRIRLLGQQPVLQPSDHCHGARPSLPHALPLVDHGHPALRLVCLEQAQQWPAGHVPHDRSHRQRGLSEDTGPMTKWRHIRYDPELDGEDRLRQWLDRNVGNGFWQHSFGNDSAQDRIFKKSRWIAFHSSVPEKTLVLFTLRWLGNA